MSEISGGELQHVAITVTLQKEADIYFFDEPSSYLDIKNRLEITKKIRDLYQKKMIITLFVELLKNI